MPNIQMRERNAANTGWNDLYPLTNAENIISSLKIIRSLKDSEGTFTRIEYRSKEDNRLVGLSVLSGGTIPNYTTKTNTYYEKDGVTVLKTEVFTLSYDIDGQLVSEV